MRALITLPHPWGNVTEPLAVGDFIQVHKGDSQGEEGCVKALGTDLNDIYMITVTTAQVTIPTVVLENHEYVGPPMISSVSSLAPYIIVI